LQAERTSMQGDHFGFSSERLEKEESAEQFHPVSWHGGANWEFARNAPDQA
jgi:hypothetical protein